MYSCSCGKEYKQLRSFQEHRSMCEVIRSTKQRNIDYLTEVPSMVDMWFIVKNLTKKCQSLESEVKKLKNYINKEKKKLSIIDWLNNNFKVKTDCLNYFKTVQLCQEDLQMIFKHGFINGMLIILTNILTISKEHIKAFDQKLNTLFVCNCNGWKILDHDDFKKLVEIIHKKIYQELSIYNKNNVMIIDDLSNNDTWYKNIKKVTGGNIDYDDSVKKIRFKLYNQIKYNLKNVIEYEFSF